MTLGERKIELIGISRPPFWWNGTDNDENDGSDSKNNKSKSNWKSNSNVNSNSNSNRLIVIVILPLIMILIITTLHWILCKLGIISKLAKKINSRKKLAYIICKYSYLKTNRSVPIRGVSFSSRQRQLYFKFLPVHSSFEWTDMSEPPAYMTWNICLNSLCLFLLADEKDSLTCTILTLLTLSYSYARSVTSFNVKSTVEWWKDHHRPRDLDPYPVNNPLTWLTLQPYR